LKPGQRHPYDQPQPPIKQRIVGGRTIEQVTSDLGGNEWNYARLTVEGFNILYHASVRMYNHEVPELCNLYMEQVAGGNRVVPLASGKCNETMWLSVDYPNGYPLEGTWIISARVYPSTEGAAAYHQLEVVREKVEQGRGQ
jgi:hypothetical protein